MRVADVMTRDVGACEATATAAEAARVMWDRDCGVVPVVEGGRLRGVVTDRDLLMAAEIQRKSPADLRLASLVQAPVATCRPEDDVAAVLATMAEKQVRRVPVTDGADRLVGIVSLNDLAIRALGDDDEMLAVARTLAAVSRHRDLAGAKR
jgi:CBS domain-containing protein